MSRRVFRAGEPFIWLTGGALATSLIMIGGLLSLILTQALGVFWPSAVTQVELRDGSRALGVVRNRTAPHDQPEQFRIQLQVGNRDLYGSDFRWVPESEIASSSLPADAVTVERREWGTFFGFVREVRDGDTVLGSTSEANFEAIEARLPAARALAARIKVLESSEISAINAALERARIARKRLETKGASPEVLQAEDHEMEVLTQRSAELHAELDKLHAEGRATRVVLGSVDGKQKELPLADLVRLYRPNSMSLGAKLMVYASKVWELVSDDPRESNTEGGIFPALFGTVMMVFLMSIAVVPFGVLAALYLREYARQGVMVRFVRIAVNNLAGVPSIVFGVFGLGFFVYTVGGTLDSLFFSDRLPTPTFGTGGILWASLTLALLTVPVVVVATEEALSAVPPEYRAGSLALGATKLETIWRVVLPNALPGILTGLILAMARGAGEVAPLMITGVVKLAPTLPFDLTFPFVHLDRKFMHLGFHIYDVGFQSPNVEAAKPMVYATTLLLVGIVVSLNLSAILIRNRLRRRFQGSAF